MERKLWAAVLADAFHDLRLKNHHGSALHWFFLSKEDGPGSLRWICQVLDLDMTYVRTRAIAVNEEYLQRAA